MRVIAYWGSREGLDLLIQANRGRTGRSLSEENNSRYDVRVINAVHAQRIARLIRMILPKIPYKTTHCFATQSFILYKYEGFVQLRKLQHQAGSTTTEHHP